MDNSLRLLLRLYSTQKIKMIEHLNRPINFWLFDWDLTIKNQKCFNFTNIKLRDLEHAATQSLHQMQALLVLLSLLCLISLFARLFNGLGFCLLRLALLHGLTHNFHILFIGKKAFIKTKKLLMRRSVCVASPNTSSLSSSSSLDNMSSRFLDPKFTSEISGRLHFFLAFCSLANKSQ